MHQTNARTIVSHVTTALLVVATIVLLVFTAIHNIWILLFFLAHRYIAVFFQSFFHHRYAAHMMFTMSQKREKIFYVLAWIAQGSSYLVPSAYAVLHRLHHKYSDTEKDPHSPIFFQDVFGLMRRTAIIYTDILHNGAHTQEFAKNYPVRKKLDTFGISRYSRIGRWLVYIGVYVLLGAQWRMFFLLPIHFLMGPVHGAIVNRAGHMVWYVNHKLADHSRNTLPIDILTVGELFQNNHHNDGSDPKFANKRREVDPTYIVMQWLEKLGIIRFTWNK